MKLSEMFASEQVDLLDPTIDVAQFEFEAHIYA
jgi:hypothetical protein